MFSTHRPTTHALMTYAQHNKHNIWPFTQLTLSTQYCTLYKVTKFFNKFDQIKALKAAQKSHDFSIIQSTKALKQLFSQKKSTKAVEKSQTLFI